MSVVLKGTALMERARELSIPGRSRMSADELRTAIAAVTDPVPTQRLDDGGGWSALLNPDPDVYGAQPTAQDATAALNAIFSTSTPADPFTAEWGRGSTRRTVTPFRARNGKRKASRTRTHRKSH